MEDEDQQFELVKRLNDKVWLARRIQTGEEFLARKVTEFDSYFDAREDGGYLTKTARHAKGHFELIYEHNLGRTMAQILNHENLVSLAGYLRQKPFQSKPFDSTQPTEDYLVTDFCDAGSLELLLVNKGQKPPLVGKSFLPESLCWHVLTSVMRGLTWLHDGYRQEIEWEKGGYKWARQDDDWMPILHRDIRAANILFQHPRGGEHYGTCKLANFSNVFLSNQPADRWEAAAEPDEPVIRHVKGSILAPPSSRLADGPDRPTVSEMRKVHTDQSKGNHSKAIYNLSDEHWALGVVLFRMMTATFIQPYGRCPSCESCLHVDMCSLTPPCTLAAVEENVECTHANGGCQHIIDTLRHQVCNHFKFTSGNECACSQTCHVKTVNIDDTLALHDYSRTLIQAVRLLFDSDRETQTTARNSIMLCTEIESLYQEWKTGTEEGMYYVDVHDDARMRYLKINKIGSTS